MDGSEKIVSKWMWSWGIYDRADEGSETMAYKTGTAQPPHRIDIRTKDRLVVHIYGPHYTRTK